MKISHIPILLLLTLFFIGCGEEYQSTTIIENSQIITKEEASIQETISQNFDEHIIPIKSIKERDDEELESFNINSLEDEVLEETEALAKPSFELLDEERIDAEEG